MNSFELDSLASKPKYAAILLQEGGCDYTIGCGITIRSLKAQNMAEADLELLEILEGFGNATRIENNQLVLSERPDPTIDKAIIIELAEIKIIDLEKLRLESKSFWQQRRDQEKLVKAKAEYERLKKQFG